MSESFSEWAIIELFGHQRIAGRVSEQQIGGCAFVRVDVPGDDKRKPFTKLLGQGSIYAITITDEVTAKACAEYIAPQPMDAWSIQEMLTTKALPAPDEDDDDYPRPDEDGGM